jgi:hypothetical protein
MSKVVTTVRSLAVDFVKGIERKPMLRSITDAK